MPDSAKDVEVVSPWVYLNRTTPLGLDYGDDGVDNGEATDDREISPVVRTEPQVHGTPVSLERHRGSFARKWDKFKGAVQRETFVAPTPPAPRVPCRDATDDEMPAECREWLLAHAHSDDLLFLRATYAQGGQERPLKQTGRCPYCSTVTTVNADESLHSHSAPKRGKCVEGAGSTPVATDGPKGECGACGVVAKLTKKGVLPSHQQPVQPCSGANASETTRPPVLLALATLPPIETVVLRIIWALDDYVLACWTFDNAGDEWIFDEAFIYDNGPKKVGISVIRRRLTPS